MWVWLVFDDENNISRDRVRRLVSFPRESDFGSLFPPAFDLNRENLILRPHGPCVRIQPLPGDLHPLGAAVEDLLQRHPQFVDDGRVLFPPWRTYVAVPRESVHVEAGEGAESVVPVHVHVLVVPAVVSLTPEEHLKRVGAPKEGGEGGMGVSMEGVGEGVAWSITGRSIASFEP